MSPGVQFPDVVANLGFDIIIRKAKAFVNSFEENPKTSKINKPSNPNNTSNMNKLNNISNTDKPSNLMNKNGVVLNG